MAGTWNTSGDTCPKCGSTNTQLTFERDIKATPTLGGPVYTDARNERYTMKCQDCGHEAPKQDIPGGKSRD